MPLQVVQGATLVCSFGTAPSVLVVPPVSRTLDGGPPAANILDHKPMVNILPFGLCTSIANPVVTSATAAAMGVLTPMPCIPATLSPWIPGAQMVKVGAAMALDNISTCMCNWAGIVKVASPGQSTTFEP
ncbi:MULTISPECIES: DUF4280 domain-containing protein [unclassified Azospirillum]|uniref:DUF4280 domain-containing protein n=1 Tax=unclassified Azospirillum TaxID=2630922 RepID=UPI000B645959|nr:MULTISPECIES: DUF4280 domain-containing protein [unclassified Azospirillum]SNS91986.1 protein of unknown function [Azospirillum sp. RU38E]SNT08971.1 protein of unknown function [Azospirillum sp. RU37A]